MPENPFEDMVGGNKSNPDRARFIDRKVVDRILEACPDAEWRRIIALARYGAPRCPSEYLTLRWEHVDWINEKIVIHARKTKRYEGKDKRTIPLFPELRQALEDVWEPGADLVINRYRGENPRTGFLRILKRAGVKPWPRLFQNLRASRQTELEEEFPTHVVCYWCGNSESIARKHYLQVTDEHYGRALQNPTHQSATSSTNGESSADQETTKTLESKRLGTPGASLAHGKVAEEGFEPPTRGL